MLKSILIGHLGGDAEVKSANGNKFVTMRIAHTSKWTGADGVTREDTIWVDVTMNGEPSVLPYLKRGQLVYVEGNVSLRCYSSPKDKCMKAGMTISARTIELLGGKTDDVPATLVNPETGEEVSVRKFYHCGDMVREETDPERIELQDRKGKTYSVDRKGWVYTQELDPKNAQQ